MAHDAIKSAPNLDKKLREIQKSQTLFFLAEYYSKENQKLSEENYVKANKVISDMQGKVYLSDKNFKIDL